jgi:hypothetical protein
MAATFPCSLRKLLGRCGLSRTGVIGRVHAGTNALERVEDPLATGDGQTIGGTDFEDEAMLRSFIFGRAREPRIGAHVEDYIRRVLDLGTVVKIGTSKASKDGRADYLLVYNGPSSWYGAVAYVNAKNAGLTLRLTKDDVADVTDPHVKFRNVQPRNEYQINCPVTTPDAIDHAVKLTQRALEKVHAARNSEPHDTGSTTA